MRFQLEQNYTQWISTALCVGLSLISFISCGALQKNQELAQTKREQEAIVRNSERDRALEVIAKEYLVDNCIPLNPNGILQVGEVMPALKRGRYPSTCLKRFDSGQFAFLAEEDGAFRMKYVYSQKELINKVSQINKK